MKKNIIIIGASSGLGKALSEELAKEAGNLFLLSRKIEEVKLPFPATKIACDVTSCESIKKAFSLIDRKVSKIDVFINCAGIGLEKKLEETTHEEIKDIIHTNLMGAIFSTQEVYKRMIKQKSGHIINISSTSGKRPREKETIYCASKWGLSGFNESLRLEAKENNIRVTTIYPGGMKTNFYKNNQEKNTSSFMDPNHVARVIAEIIKSSPSLCPSEVVIERM